MSTGGGFRVVDGALDALVTVDEKQRIVDLNPAAEGMFGFERGKVIGEDMNDLIVPPEQRDVQRAAFDRAIVSGEVRLLAGGTARFEGLRTDGTRFPLELTLNVTSEDPVQVTAWIHDRSREELVERQATLTERVESAINAGSWEWHTESGYVLWSDSLFRMFGYDSGEVDPSPELVLQHTHPDDRERVAGILQGMIETGQTEPYEFRIISRTGDLVYLYVTLAFVDSVDGGRALIGSVLDLTAQRDAERRANVLAAIVEWTAKAVDMPLEEAIAGLLESILPVSEAVAASFWAPKGGLLRCHVTRGAESLDTAAFVDACGKVELPPGAGLPGRAWAEERVTYLRPGESNDHVRQRAMDTAELVGGVAVPAVSAAGTIAVFEMLFREPLEPSPQGIVTLRACGVLVGEFLAQRRGELETTTLTKREIEILQLASEGLTGPKIAAHLVISPATVKSHFEHIYPKLGVRDRSNAVAEALRLGLIR